MGHYFLGSQYMSDESCPFKIEIHYIEKDMKIKMKIKIYATNKKEKKNAYYMSRKC